MNKPLTVKELAKLCQDEIKKGHGEYSIMLSDDDEGNGYHYLWYSFITASELDGASELENSLDERIAPKDKTIILG